MKVDKAVCTTDTMTDAGSAISYENLLSTLVQKKILAIKRECEAKQVEKQKRKQQNCLGSFIFGNRNDRPNKCDDGDGDGDGDREPAKVVVASNEQVPSSYRPPSISQQATDTDSKGDMRKGDDNNQATVAHNVLRYNQMDTEQIDSIVLVNCAQVNDQMHVENEAMAQIKSSPSSKCQIDVRNERCDGSSENDNNSTTQTSNRFDGDSEQQSVNGKNRIRNTEHFTGDTQNIIGNPLMGMEHVVKSKNDNDCIELDIESTSTTTNTKSPSIVSQIEVSDEINPKQQQQQQQRSRARKNSSDTISMPSSLKQTVFSAPANAAAMAVHDQEQRHQIRLLEAKSISAQCSPIFAQRQTFNGRFFKFFNPCLPPPPPNPILSPCPM